MTDNLNGDPFATPLPEQPGVPASDDVLPPPPVPGAVPPPYQGVAAGYQQQPAYPAQPEYAQPQYAQPGYADPNAYGQPAYGQPAYAAPQVPNKSKNILGILSIIAPFVFLGLVGVILGHMGVSAAKKGQATNKGLAIAGTILSWLSVIGGIIGLLFFIFVARDAVTVTADLDEEDETEQAEDYDPKDAVWEDLKNLQIAVANYLVDNPSDFPDIEVDGDVYDVGGVDEVDVTAKDPSLDAYSDIEAGHFCIEIEEDEDNYFASIDESGNLTEDPCPDYSAEPEETEGGSSEGDQVWDLLTGDCLLNPLIDPETGEELDMLVNGYTLVSCDELHYGEVFYSGPIGVQDFPGNDELYAIADGICYPLFADYVGVPYEESSLYYDVYYPTENSWNAGDDQVDCVITSDFGDTVGSVYGTGQ